MRKYYVAYLKTQAGGRGTATPPGFCEWLLLTTPLGRGEPHRPCYTMNWVEVETLAGPVHLKDRSARALCQAPERFPPDLSQACYLHVGAPSAELAVAGAVGVTAPM